LPALVTVNRALTGCRQRMPGLLVLCAAVVAASNSERSLIVVADAGNQRTFPCLLADPSDCSSLRVMIL
jgi:hypothetical protein